MLLYAKTHNQTDSAHDRFAVPEDDFGTLIIHPTDPTTDFLKVVYAGRPAITGTTPPEVLLRRITASERVVCLGHGIPQGLFGCGRLVVDESHAGLLRAKRENVLVWCNADCYARLYGVNGFATGMFISEPSEARVLNVRACAEEIRLSNELFARILAGSIDRPAGEILDRVMDEYRASGNKAVEYNRRNMYLFK